MKPDAVTPAVSVMPVSQIGMAVCPTAPHAITPEARRSAHGELQIASGLPPQDSALPDELLHTLRRIRRNESLYRAGDAFHSLYAVRSGFLKTCMVTDDGREQVMGFHMTDELLGTDGIAAETHSLHAVALEDSEVHAISYAQLIAVASQDASLLQHLYKILSQEISRTQDLMLLLGSMRAEEQLACFLLNLSRRFAARGYSASEFTLRMKRDEIGSYLGLTVETVSRIFTKLQDLALISVQQKQVQIRDMAGLEFIAGRCPSHGPQTLHPLQQMM